MPIQPSVFQPIRSRDLTERTFQAYKHYHISNTSFNTSSGHIRHDGVYKKHINVGDTSYDYPLNADDQTNKHAVWSIFDHKYYRHPYDPSKTNEHFNKNKVTKFLAESASSITIPYMDAGEKLKPGSIIIHANDELNNEIYLADDTNGNLLDSDISASNFASASNCFFHLSFNNEFRQFESGNRTGNLHKTTYKLNGRDKEASVHGKIDLTYGVQLHDSVNHGGITSSGFAVQWLSASAHDTSYLSGSYIRIPHDDIFNEMNVCDNWAISFWCRFPDGKSNDSAHVVSKYGVKEELYYDNKDKLLKKRVVDKFVRGKEIGIGQDEDGRIEKIKTPFDISVTNNLTSKFIINFKNCDGGNMTNAVFSSSISDPMHWRHCLIVNSGSKIYGFIDGENGGYNINGVSNAAILPTANQADIMIGHPFTNWYPYDLLNTGPSVGASGMASVNQPINMNFQLSELRFYNYAPTRNQIRSLANNNYISASLYQNNVAGNVFYKNHQIVVSSPLPKYHSGSGIFGNKFDLRYRGTHTIYENQAFIRLPKEQCNVSMNPSATFRLQNDGTFDPCRLPMQKEIPPGEQIKHMFLSGTASPYITSIGLYNEHAQLLALAKLAQPVLKRDDIDMHFLLRWDY